MDRFRDKSFEGLLFSLGIHAILVLLLLNISVPPSSLHSDRTEITIVEEKKQEDPKSKAQTFMTETEKKEKDLKDLKDTADYLSQFTKRVKKQFVARNNGPTRNSQPTVIPLAPKNTSGQNRVAGKDTDSQQKTNTPEDRGIGLPPPGGSQGMSQVMLGPSSIQEYIPGLEANDFTMLNTDQFTYYAYYDRINKQVPHRWIAGIRSYISRMSTHDLAVLARMDRETVGEIILTSEGDFSSSVLHHSSGDRNLDEITVEAFRDAAPFLNPPKGMIEGDGKIHLRYRFMARFRPPIDQTGS